MKTQSQEQNHKELIHVPQGRAGRLLQSVNDSPFNGLITYGFNSCSAIVFINKQVGRISLAHADQMYDTADLVSEMQWVGAGCDIIILHHTEGENLMRSFQQKFPQNPVQVHCLADELFAMSVSFTESAHNKLHPLISTYTKKQLPKNICVHPNEFELITAHRIQRLFFVRSLSIAKINRVIFSGRFWTTFNPREFKPRPVDGYDQNFLKKLKPKGYFDSGKYVSEYLRDAIRANPRLKFEEDPTTFSLQIGIDISIYVNQYDIEKCLQLDVAEILDMYHNQANTPEDKQFCTSLKEAISDKSKCSTQVDTILQNPQQLTPDIEKLKKEIKTSLQIYKKRTIFTKQNLRNQIAAKLIEQLGTKAKEAFTAKNYLEAQNLYQQCLTLALRFVTNEDKALAAHCYNLGRSAQFARNDILAYRYISLTLNLYREYHQTDKERLQKTIDALEAIVKTMINSDDPQAKQIAENFVSRNAHIAASRK